MQVEKFEARNPKQFQNEKRQNTEMFETRGIAFNVLDFPSLRLNWLRVCFGFRASDFELCVVT